MAKAPIVTETQNREQIGLDADGREVWLTITRQADGLVTTRLSTRFEEGPEQREWIDLTNLRLQPFEPPAWWLAIKSPSLLYDAGDLCSVQPTDGTKLVPAEVLMPCPKRVDYYQVRQWQAHRHRWGPGRAVPYLQLRRAWG